MGTLDRKTALITGGSRGIGAAISKALAAEGAEVAVNYSSSESRAREVVDEIEASGGKAFAVAGNVASPESVSAMFAEIDQHFGGSLDILVNNAGIAESKSIAEATLDDFDKTMQVNVRGLFDVTRHAVQRLRDGGRVISIGSCMATRGFTSGMSAYIMSKAAVAGLTRGWAHDLGGRGIAVTCIQPGPIDTDMNPDAEENTNAGALREMTTLKRYGKAKEVGDLVAFLASPAAQYITGEMIGIDGGINA